jgi:hypothetical protein
MQLTTLTLLLTTLLSAALATPVPPQYKAENPPSQGWNKVYGKASDNPDVNADGSLKYDFPHNLAQNAKNEPKGFGQPAGMYGFTK